MKKINILLLMLLAPLASCYTLREDVIVDGEYAPIAGKLDCNLYFNGKQFSVALKEETSGIFSKSYVYKPEDDKNVIKMKKIDENFYLSEMWTVGKENEIAIYYIIFAKNGFRMFVADNLTGQGTRNLVELSKPYGFKMSVLNDRSWLIEGQPDKILEYLVAHKPSNLQYAGACVKL